MELRTQKADNIRGVIRYLQKFKNATVVIYLDDKLFDSPLFSSHIKDIALLHASGLKVVIVPGAKKRINEVLGSANISWAYKDNVRITDDEAIPLIKMAAFDVSNIVMTNLAANKINAVIGNWVTSRAIGVLDGQDFGTAGEISRLDIDAVHKILNDGFIPIFPCIGWSLNGKPYNISSMQLAKQIALHMKADKLFFLVPGAELSSRLFELPSDLGLSPEGHVPAMNIEELDSFIRLNEKEIENSSASENKDLKKNIISILKLSKEACTGGVSRAHIVDGFADGTLPCEIFSDLGSGTMIYSTNYGKIRAMRREDISPVISLMRPFIEQGILLPRSKEQLENTYNDYIIYEIDGAVRACAALHIYDRKQAEIAGVAVDETCAHIGIGPKMIEYLISKAKTINLESVFILTTQTADWFESLGFKKDTIDSIPESRIKIWNPDRGSKVYRLNLI